MSKNLDIELQKKKYKTTATRTKSNISKLPYGDAVHLIPNTEKKIKIKTS